MKNYISIFLIAFCLLGSSHFYAQDGFKFFDKSKKYEEVKFELINNLVVIPLEINGKNLNFIFDTGVNKTIVFNANKSDTVFYRSKTIYKLRGLGGGDPVDAIISRNNRFRIDDLVSHNQSVYIILEDKFDLSSKMGKTIHGVIGFDILKNLVVRLDYRNRRMRLYDKDYFTWKKCRKCEEFPLTIFRNKPYIDVSVSVNDTLSDIPVKMLIDSGGSDALWLFEYSKENLVTPTNYFDDFLGVGLSGTIYGKRSRITDLKIGPFQIEAPTVSFLDSLSTQNARQFALRNGSIGSNILKRFMVWIDYENKRLMLKKNGSFKGGFEYNMSGIEVVYDGKRLVEEKTVRFGESYGRSANSTRTASNSVTLVTSYQYKFKPRFKVNEVVKGSPADEAGVMKNDLLLKINGEDASDLTLSEIISKFQRKPNKRMRLTLERNGQIIVVEFRLKKLV